MVQKRQLYEEEYDVSAKHLKLEHDCDLVPCLQLDAGCFSKPDIEVEKGFVSGNFTDLPVRVVNDVDCTPPGRLSTSSFTSSTISDEDVMSAAPPLANNAYSRLLERYPLKLVAVGPEYQASIPEWHECNGDENKFMGTSVIPMPENQIIHGDETVGRGRTDCDCHNLGSIECVKQHIKESREVLKARIGLKAFVDLGFGDMGEVVAERWTEDDEQLFHKVVYSNPMSSGRNFWNHLEAAFPYRNSQEIVSYYFNVFMLRRRTEQNRVDPINADSDDDESQEYDPQPRKSYNSCSFDSTSEKTIAAEDLQCDSCTSSDTTGALSRRQVNPSWVNQEFSFEPLDSRVWDAGYFSFARTKTDFLPTGSMIEEVFGDESWNFETADDSKS